MATTEQLALARLATTHQRQQTAQAEALRRALQAAWRASRSDRGAGNEKYLQDAIRLIGAQYKASLSLAVAFYGMSRSVGAVRPPRFSPEPVTFDPEQARVSQVATALEEAGRTGDVERAGTVGAVAGVRVALSGGRRGLLGAIATDSVALGYFWQTRQDGQAPCSWCAMLASRGVVYKADSWPSTDPRPHGFLKVEAHDGCACHLAPVWSRSQEIPDETQNLEAQWRASTRTFSGDAKVRAWRSWYGEWVRTGDSSPLALEAWLQRYTTRAAKKVAS